MRRTVRGNIGVSERPTRYAHTRSTRYANPPFFVWCAMLSCAHHSLAFCDVHWLSTERIESVMLMMLMMRSGAR
eukprot:8789913-Pyramimonas_sp.AAC.1